MNTLTKGFVAINAAVWVSFGPAFYFWPEVIASYLDIALQSPTALADFRAVHGGIPLGAGLFMGMGLRRPEWLGPALMLILLGTAGLLAGRMLTVIDTGGVGQLIYLFMALEAGTIVLGAWLYRNQQEVP